MKVVYRLVGIGFLVASLGFIVAGEYRLSIAMGLIAMAFVVVGSEREADR